jgi:hypothetical protein
MSLRMVPCPFLVSNELIFGKIVAEQDSLTGSQYPGKILARPERAGGDGQDRSCEWGLAALDAAHPPPFVP